MSGTSRQRSTTGVDRAVSTGADHSSPVPVRRLVRGTAIIVPVAGLAYALLFSAPAADEVRAAMTSLRPSSVVLALAAETVHLLALAQAYRVALAAGGARLPLRRQLTAFLAGTGVGQLLPAGGAVGGAVVGQRMISFGAPRAATAAAVALTGTLSLLSAALLVGVGLLTASIVGAGSPRFLPVVAIAVVVLVGMVSALLAIVRTPARGHRMLDRIVRPLRRMGVDTDAWRSSLDHLGRTPPTVRGLVGVVGWTLAAWTANIVALWACFASIDHRLPLDVLLVGFGSQHLVAMIPVSPGGVGVVEAGMAGTYTALGVAGGTAVTGVVVYRLVAFWLPVLVGLTVHVRLVLRDDRDGGPAREITPDVR